MWSKREKSNQKVKRNLKVKNKNRKFIDLIILDEFKFN